MKMNKLLISFGLFVSYSICFCESANQTETSVGSFEWSDRQVLEYLYETTHGDFWDVSTNWGDPSKSICEWQGVNCLQDGKEDVVSVILPNNGITGSLPMAHLLAMPYLQELILSGNAIGLDFSTDGLRLEAISRPSKLLKLDLGNTQVDDLSGFNGPGGRGTGVPELTELRLSHCNLAGTFPSAILHMTSLRELSLDFNDLTGSIPDQLSDLSNLMFLTLDDNALTGSIPASIGNLVKLEALQMQNNILVGELPTELQKLTALETLDLSGQRDTSNSGGIRGKLLPFTGMTKITRIDLSNNAISGLIPENLLQDIDSNLFEDGFFGNNYLSGTIPSTLASLPLDKFYFQNNRLTGFGTGICQGITECDRIACAKNSYSIIGRAGDSFSCTACPSGSSSPYLGMTTCVKAGETAQQDLNVSITLPVAQADTAAEKTILESLFHACGGLRWRRQDNWLNSDDYCSWYGITCSTSSKSVARIVLSSNNLRGTPPAELFDLPELKALVLNGNDILFDMEGIGNAMKLEILDLTSTGLISLEGIGQARSLTELSLASNELRGTIPAEIFYLGNLEELILDFNTFDVEALPSDIVELNNLKFFSCAKCGLKGPVPNELEKLTQLSSLRLDGNSFSGTLPEFLQNLNSLSYLDLSSQTAPGLTGSLLSFSNSKNMRKLYLNNNGLSGTIPSDFLASVDLATFETADLSQNSLSGVVPGNLASIIHEVYLEGNAISSIDQRNCKNPEIEQFGCDGVLCPPGTFSVTGRQMSVLESCMKCSSSVYFGTIVCNDVLPGNSNSTGSGGNTNTNTGTQHDWSDAEILNKLYLAMGGPSWVESSNWLSTKTPICAWYGIKCRSQSSGAVESIALKSNNLQGDLPSEIFLLRDLRSLLLDGNPINVDFSSMHLAPNLQIVDFSHTNVKSLTGLAPNSHLTDLHLASTSLSGPFPPEILALSGLLRLTLDDNSLTGQFPAAIDQLPSLEWLSAHNNKFNGTIPETISNIETLEFLMLENNYFSGPLPESLSTLPKLWFLDVSNQGGDGGKGLSGPLPSFATGYTSIRRIDVSHNSLSGTVSASFLADADSYLLELADFSSNKIQGKLSTALSRFRLGTYNFQDNEISGLEALLCASKDKCNAILCPSGSYNPQGREISANDPCLPCAANNFFGSTRCGSEPESTPLSPTGYPSSDREILEQLYDECGGPRWAESANWKTNQSICTWFGIRCAENTENALLIMLSGNNLVGTPPSTIFNLPLLNTLILDSNEILFRFDGIQNATNLETIDLSSTGLNSLDGIEKSASLANLHVASNELVGSIPQQLFQLPKLQRLTLDFNRFSGELPQMISRASELEIFSCAGNLLSGQLPAGFGLLQHLQSLRLPMNKLTGTFPDSLAKLASLEVLDVSDQLKKGGGIRGPLPDFLLLVNLRHIDLSGNTFSGSLPSSFLCNVTRLFEFADLSNNLLTGILPKEVAPIVERIYLRDNMISGIAPELCSPSLGGNIVEFACDAILCPPGTWNTIGKQDSGYNPCTECRPAQYFGSSSCECLYNASTNSNCDGFVYFLPDGQSNETIDDYGIHDHQDTDYYYYFGDNTTTDRMILENFYDTCGGYYWWQSKNWMDNSKSICEWFGVKCVDNKGEHVKSLQLDANNVKGTPPGALFQLPHLTTLSLYANPDLSFNFEGIENAQQLKRLVLDATGLDSIDGISKAPNLLEFEARFNKLQGTLSQEIAQLKSLKRLSVSHNALVAPLPDFSSLSSLQDLLLAENKIETTLDEIHLPSSVRMLDLSGNLIGGTIPSTFLNNLPENEEILIDLGNNKLTGAVPSSLARFDDLSLQLRNNELTSMEPEICAKSKWNGGDVGRYGCSGLLCPIGTSSSNGRQSSKEGRCVQCKESQYLGSSACSNDKLNLSAASRMPSRWIAITICSFIASFILM